ncbi:OprD family outer membrane porin [Duganella sp. CF517]|uniref:OprD family outer membrane porin n=1 Tax=Duganella sp. CF517 TaxID=1881038 RepID=UPI001C4341B3|nr:OprD family outer membrane porin [Duganella sp. CF517]
MLTTVAGLSGQAGAADPMDASAAHGAPEMLAAATLPAMRGGDARQTAPPFAAAAAAAEPPSVPAGGTLNILFRNYRDSLTINGHGTQRGWVQGAQANFVSGLSSGQGGFGVDASLFGAVKLDGDGASGDMVHVDRDGGGGERRKAWAYMGGYAVKARYGGMLLKYGLQQVENVFLESKDNRALPPAFRGMTLTGEPAGGVGVEAGSIDAVDPRGRTGLVGLKSAYGGTPISRLSYGGVNLTSESGKVSVYAAQARDVWNQLFVAGRHSAGASEASKWTVSGAAYLTREQGAALQGPIGGKAYSVALARQLGASELAVSFQHVMSDQYLDYVQEANGLYLANGMVADYNAPREKSLQLRYTANGADFSLPGMSVILWGIAGRSKSPQQPMRAAPDAGTWRDAYWRGGAHVHGNHHELGLKASYVFDRGDIKAISLAFIALVHRGSPHYVEPSEREYRLILNVPVKVF